MRIVFLCCVLLFSGCFNRCVKPDKIIIANHPDNGDRIYNVGDMWYYINSDGETVYTVKE